MNKYLYEKITTANIKPKFSLPDHNLFLEKLKLRTRKWFFIISAYYKDVSIGKIFIEPFET